MTRTPAPWPAFLAAQPAPDCPSLSPALGSWSDPADPPEDHAGAIGDALTALHAALQAAYARGGARVSDAAGEAMELLDGWPDFQRAAEKDIES